MKTRFIAPLRLLAGALAPVLALAPATLRAQEDAAEPDPAIELAALVDSDGDLIPDARDPIPLVANVPVYWSVQKFALSRPQVADPPDTSWANAPALDIAAVLPAPKAPTSLTAMPLAARKAAGPLTGHPFARLALFGSDALRFGDLSRARTAAFLRGWRLADSRQPITLAFTVHFVNLDSRNWTFNGLEVPVVLDGRVWTSARAKAKDPNADGEGVFLPADGQVRALEFTADVEASQAETFLTRLAKSESSPVFDFSHATGLDPAVSAESPDPNAYSLTAAFGSILATTRQIRIEGPDGRIWNWRVAPVDLASGEPVTMRLWTAGMNSLSEQAYRAPLFAFDGDYPISVTGWDNGCWDLYWAARRKNRALDISRLLETRLDADITLELGHQPPERLPVEGASPIVAHLRGVWFWNNGMADLAFENFATAGRDGVPQGYSWYGRGRELQPADPETPGANLADAARFYKLAADKNYAPGLAWHGRALLRGEGGSQDKTSAAAALRKAAEQGFAEGRVLYALCLERGLGVKANPNEAKNLLLQAAWQENRAAQSSLGTMLLDSKSLEGRDWLELAADAGDEKAAARLARLLRDGEMGIPADADAAASWLQIAADRGDAPSLVALGEAYRAGAGVGKNMKKAATCFRRAAEAGNNDGRTWYAICLLEGTGVRRNIPAALDLLAAAAEGGHTGAQYFLGACLFGGFGGTEPNQAEAMRYFQAAARQQPAANVFLGVGYLNGTGVAKNEKKAFECFKAAADKDLPAGILWVAHCHANGIGVKKDLEEARKWAKKAIELGIPAGRQMLLSIQE